MDDSDSGGDDTRQSSVTSEDGFQDALRSLIDEAESNGVDVRGKWPVSRADAAEPVEVEVTDLSGHSTIHARNGTLTVPSITEAVMEREGVDTTDLPPLHDHINPDLLELLYDSGGPGSEQYLTFDYAGYRITACSDGTIVLDG